MILTVNSVRAEANARKAKELADFGFPNCINESGTACAGAGRLIPATEKSAACLTCGNRQGEQVTFEMTVDCEHRTEPGIVCRRKAPRSP